MPTGARAPGMVLMVKAEVFLGAKALKAEAEEARRAMAAKDFMVADTVYVGFGFGFGFVFVGGVVIYQLLEL